jgi:hypothetical protein
MEEVLLQGMIRDWETQIKLIEKKMTEQTKKMDRLQKQRVELEASDATTHVSRQLELEGMRQRLQRLVQQYQQLKDSLDMKRQSQSAQAQTGMHLYNEIVKAAAVASSPDGAADQSSYVMRMQAQLCKAMHSMGMMETQLQLVTGQAEVYTKYLKDSVTGMVEEKSQVELKLMNDLVAADIARREVETTTKEMSEALSREKDELMDKIKRQHKKAEEGGAEDGAGEDGNNEEEKEELMEILTQGREEIGRLEQENKIEAERLEALKLKVAASRGQDVIDEIVSNIAEEFKEREGGSDNKNEDDDEEEED